MSSVTEMATVFAPTHTSSETSTPRLSSESLHAHERVQVVSSLKQSKSLIKKAARKIKKALAEHHTSVNAAYNSYYGSCPTGWDVAAAAIEALIEDEQWARLSSKSNSLCANSVYDVRLWLVLIPDVYNGDEGDSGPQMRSVALQRVINAAAARAASAGCIRAESDDYSDEPLVGYLRVPRAVRGAAKAKKITNGLRLELAEKPNP
ncbi:hypothetical protein BJ878DRAFT_568640 [Calycina marina]|uniref:Uncharacterized protein n=1 Tax=Calycina marina TaxID=1763456 RepID=A0A9P7Z0X6_9HELO|nr:hypothetical protein BJ878DRAFT_568640 [Calycina marina]